MGYLLAAYAVTAVVLVGYALRLRAARARDCCASTQPRG